MLKIMTIRATIAAILAGVCMSAHAIADSPKPVDIPAGDLRQALLQVSEQFGTDLVFSPDQVQGLKTGGAHGQLTTEQAVTKLLEGTPLELRTDPSGAMLIAPPAAKEAPQVSTDGEPSKFFWSRLRLAQSDIPSASQGEGRDEDGEAAQPQKTIELEEIIVTGSSIAGGVLTSPVIRTTREEIERAGLSTLGDALRALPQNYNGGQNPGVYGALGATEGNQNFSGASTPNLRGLGSGATLTLVDGRRLALNGFGAGSDLSTIPLAAVERVEILTDGASAIYGSDAIAGVVNVILRKDFEGAEVRARFGDSTGGGAAEQQYGTVLGGAWDSGSALISYEYRTVDALYSLDRSFAARITDPTMILPEMESNSAFVRVRQDVGGSATIFLDAVYSDRDMHQTVTDFGALQVTDVGSEQYSATAGAELQLGESWTATVSATSARDLAAQSALFTFPTFAFSSLSNVVNRMRVAELLSSGPLVSIPTGDIRLAVGGGYREESFGSVVPGGSTRDHTGERDARYVFAEVQVPIVPESSSRRGLNRIDLTMAGRYEGYSDFGSSTNPKFGILYKPTRDVSLRASWGTSFRAPTFEQLVGIRAVQVQRLVTPTPSGQTQVLLTGGGNPNLEPEEAESWSTSIEYEPTWLPGLALTAGIYEVRFSDRIVAPFRSAAQALANPAINAPFIVTSPSPQLQSEIVANASPGQFVNRSGLPYSAANVGYVVYAHHQNVSERTARGADVSASYSWRLGASELSAFFSGAYLDEEQKFTAASPQVVIAGTIFNPPELRVRSGVTWGHGALSILAAMNYTDEADNNVSLVQRSVASWATFDASLTYAPDARGFLRGVHARLAVQNVTDRDPPFVAPDSTAATGVEYDSTNATPLGRFMSVDVVKRF